MKQAGTIKRTPVKSSKPKNRLETPLEQTTYSEAEFFQKVQELAYRIYVARGCAHGYDVEDWLAAEEIVKAS
jgi:hypothetical protein